MASFCVDAGVLGTDRHLVCSDTGFTWRMTVPDGVWHLTGTIKPQNDRCLDSLLRLAGVTVDLSPPVRFVNAATLVLSGSVLEGLSPPWSRMIPREAHRAFTKGIIDAVVVAMAQAPAGYFCDTWVPGNVVLRSLVPAKVDRARWQDLLDAGVGNARVVETFRPGADGFAGRTDYDRFGTLTGRLTVTGGPGILTLKREHRNILVPSTPGGRIVSIDFAALEARVLLYEAGRRCDDVDLYGSIAKELGGGITRKAVKGAVICELYGSSKAALGEALGIGGKELTDFVKRVRSYFNTAELLKRIKQQFVATGRIINRYGRPVSIDEPLSHIMINYYAQSTGADVALLGFSQVITRLVEQAPEVRALYLLHDGMFLDVPENRLEQVMAIDHVYVPGYVQKFFLKVEACTP